MNLDVSNLKVFKHNNEFALQIIMPDESKNFLHSESFLDINDAVKIKDQLMGMVVRSENLLILNDESYFRIDVVLRPKEKSYSFHSRKLNLNDVVFERDQLLI